MLRDYASAATLCHFDRETMDPTEALDFVARQIVEVDGALIATDSSDHVRRRRAGEAEWATLVGYLHLERPDITWYVPMIVGPGQFLLAGSSGQIYVTVPPTSTP